MQKELARVQRLREIAERYRAAIQPQEREMSRIAAHIVGKWDATGN